MFLEKSQTQFSRYSENLPRRSFRQTSFDLGQLELLEAPRTLQTQLEKDLHDEYSVVFYKKCSVTIFGV